MMCWKLGLVSVLVLAVFGCDSPSSGGEDTGSTPGGSQGDSTGIDEQESSDEGDGGTTRADDGDSEDDSEDDSDGGSSEDSTDGDAGSGTSPTFACTQIDLGDALPAVYTGDTGPDDTGVELVCGDWLGSSVGLWFEWTAPSDGSYRITAEGASLDLVVAVVSSCEAYFGDCPEPDIDLDVSAGETILFAVTEWEGDSGELTVTIESTG